MVYGEDVKDHGRVSLRTGGGGGWTTCASVVRGEIMSGGWVSNDPSSTPTPLASVDMSASRPSSPSSMASHFPRAFKSPSASLIWVKPLIRDHDRDKRPLAAGLTAIAECSLASRAMIAIRTRLTDVASFGGSRCEMDSTAVAVDAIVLPVWAGTRCSAGTRLALRSFTRPVPVFQAFAFAGVSGCQVAGEPPPANFSSSAAFRAATLAMDVWESPRRDEGELVVVVLVMAEEGSGSAADEEEGCVTCGALPADGGCSDSAMRFFGSV